METPLKAFNESGINKIDAFKPGEYALHGDVILFMEESIPGDFEDMKKLDDGVLALGEATLHMHKIIGEPDHYDLRECPKTKTRHLRVVEPVMLKHQEHSPFILPPGDYKIGIQREYDPFEKLVRRVAD